MKWKNPLRQNALSGRKVSAKQACAAFMASHACAQFQSLPSLLAKILRELKPGQPDMLARHGIGNICRISIQAHIGIKAAILHIHHQQGRAVAKRLLIHAHNAKAIAVDRRVNQIQLAIIEDKIRTRTARRQSEKRGPGFLAQIVVRQKPLLALLLPYEIVAPIAHHIRRIFPPGIVGKIRRGHIFQVIKSRLLMMQLKFPEYAPE